MSSKIKAIIFDLDGVLIDSEIQYMKKLQEFAEKVLKKKLSDEIFLPIVGATGQAHWNVIRSYCPDVWDRDDFRKSYRKFLDKNPIVYSDIIFPDICMTMEWLRDNGYRIALATSTPMEKEKSIVLECGIKKYFELELTGDMFAESKPNPEIYLTCLSRLNLNAEECLVVEDSAIGIEAAVCAGIPVVARIEKRYPIDQSKADFYIEKISELIHLLQQLNSKR